MDPKRSDGQDGTSTVELALLLPVYMLLFVGVLTVGQLVLARQEVVLAVRYQAWLPNDSNAQLPATINNNFFPSLIPYGSGFTQTFKGTQPVDFMNAGSASNALLKLPDFPSCFQSQGASNNEDVSLAEAVMNDTVSGTRHLELSAVTGQFSYSPAWVSPFLLGAATTLPTTSCAVYVRTPSTSSSGAGSSTSPPGDTKVERKVLDVEGGNSNLVVTDHNPIEDYAVPSSGGAGGGGGGSGQVSFPISLTSQTNNRFYTPYAPDKSNPAESAYSIQSSQVASSLSAPAATPAPLPSGFDANVGIWNTAFRLGGDINSEHTFFQSMLYPGSN
jgi:hypothetical protein